jgi:hypothetical protein
VISRQTKSEVRMQISEVRSGGRPRDFRLTIGELRLAGDARPSSSGQRHLFHGAQPLGRRYTR